MREKEGEGDRGTERGRGREREGAVQCMNVFDHKMTDNSVNSCGNIFLNIHFFVHTFFCTYMGRTWE